MIGLFEADRTRAQPLVDGEAVRVGHHHVEDDEIGKERGAEADGLLATRGDHDIVPTGCERFLHETSDVRLVVDDKDPLRHA